MQNTIDSLQSELDQLRMEVNVLRSRLDKIVSQFSKINTVLFDNPNAQINMDEVLMLACMSANVKMDAVLSKNRNKENVIARHLFINYSRRVLERSYTEIGHKIQRDHATVMYSMKRIDGDLQFKRKYEQFETQLNKQYAPIH